MYILLHFHFYSSILGAPILARQKHNQRFNNFKTHDFRSIIIFQYLNIKENVIIKDIFITVQRVSPVTN